MEPIQLNGNVTLKAAAENGKQPPRVTIVAYTGGLMRVPGWGPIAIDLKGLQIRGSVALLADHDAKISGVVGSGTPSTDGRQLLVNGTLAASVPAATAILDLARSGVSFQASVGVEPLETTETRSATVNGRNIESAGFFTLIRKGRLREVSITAVGADPDTSVAIAARKRDTMKRKTTKAAAVIADPDDTIEPIDTAEPGDQGNAGDMIAASQADPAADVERIQAIRSVCQSEEVRGGRRVVNSHPEIAARAIAEGWSVNRTAVEVVRATSLPLPSTIIQGSYSRSSQPRDLITAGLMLHAGRQDLAEKTFGERTAQEAVDLRCHSLVDLCAASLRVELRDVPRDRNEMIRAAFSSLSLPTALGNLADKLSAEAFTETPAVWPFICRRRPVNNFRQHSIVRVLFVGNFEELAPGGELKHGSIEEGGTRTVQAFTKGKIFGVTRQDLVNDDLSVFSDTAIALARAAARTMNDDFASTLLANAGNFFHASNANYTSGASTALSVTSLTSAIGAMMKQTDSKDRNIDVRPRVLLTPPELRKTAQQILVSTELARYTSSTVDNMPMGNPLQKALDHHDEPRLSNTESFTGASATAWYLFGAVADGAVNVALLNGRATPVIEQEAAPFNTLGLLYRGYMDYGFDLGEPVAAYKSAGA